MKYLLEENEMANLIHKDRIRMPVDEFLSALEKAVRKNMAFLNVVYGHGEAQQFMKELETAIKTLRIKLDL